MVSLSEQVALRVHQSTHGRVRDLTVCEDHGRIIIRGQAST